MFINVMFMKLQVLICDNYFASKVLLLSFYLDLFVSEVMLAIEQTLRQRLMHRRFIRSILSNNTCKRL